jgi:antitoxin component YwqK of YwqJK toxin-antitoxin module
MASRSITMRTANSPFKWMVEQGKEDGTLKRYTADGQLQQVAQFNDGVINAANSKYIKLRSQRPMT